VSHKVLIFGAGAIGRGFLAPVLFELNYQISFVDSNPNLVAQLKRQRKYRAAIAGPDRYEFISIPIEEVFLPSERLAVEDYDLVFSCVGPKNCCEIAAHFKNAQAVISCENDRSTVDGLKELSGNDNIFFGIPDVITSYTAPRDLLEIDSLTTVTEKGELILERGNYILSEKIKQVDPKELHMHWMCKLFIHNAPHAIVAYLGWLKNHTYIHEAMADQEIREIVMGAMEEITAGVIGSGYAEKNFANVYKNTEASRFSNQLLFDEIIRVAREPIRKISPDNRLVLALRIALFNGIHPKNIAYGLNAALRYDNKADEEATYLQNLQEALTTEQLLDRFCGITPFDPLSQYIQAVELPDGF
jgi:mannitol-1-phosphate 5-dehydrogenase